LAYHAKEAVADHRETAEENQLHRALAEVETVAYQVVQEAGSPVGHSGVERRMVGAGGVGRDEL
jgi:hypothetical protein